MHEHLKSILLQSLAACTPALHPDDDQPRLDPCADENEFASRVAEMGVSLSLRGRMQQRRRQVEEALRRLDLGGYGLCEDCGDEIGAARLMANPVATLCVHCQAEQERAALRRCA